MRKVVILLVIVAGILVVGQRRFIPGAASPLAPRTVFSFFGLEISATKKQTDTTIIGVFKPTAPFCIEEIDLYARQPWDTGTAADTCFIDLYDVRSGRAEWIGTLSSSEAGVETIYFSIGNKYLYKDSVYLVRFRVQCDSPVGTPPDTLNLIIQLRPELFR